MASERPAHPLLPFVVRVRRRRREMPDIVSLELEPARPSLWPGFAPGQFTMLYAPGVGEIPVSISGDPADAGRIVQTIRDVGAVSRVLAALQPGDPLGLRGPYGQPWPVDDARGQDVVLIAGGLGLAPLRPAILHLLRARAAYGRLLLLYGARSPADILFRKQLERWRGRFDMYVDVTVDHAGTGWRGPVGTVTKLIEQANFAADVSHAFVCGPEIMMRYSARALQDRGVDPARIYLSMERNMQCAIGQCGHCQLGPEFICKDGPVLSLARLRPRLGRREL